MMKMSIDKAKIARDFISQFQNGFPSDIAAAMEPLSADAIYQMVTPTIAPIQGKSAIIEAIQKMDDKEEDFNTEILFVAASENVVFIERIDQAKRNGKWLPTSLVGVFEINDDGKITAWRDYMDLFYHLKQHGESFEEMEKSMDLN